VPWRQRPGSIAELDFIHETKFVAIKPNGSTFAQARPLLRHEIVDHLWLPMVYPGRRIYDEIPRIDVITIDAAVIKRSDPVLTIRSHADE
jgi:hypothetical protein